MTPGTCVIHVQGRRCNQVCLQVVMGYAHSLAIARHDSQQEEEKLKKLPEYNPRTI